MLLRLPESQLKTHLLMRVDKLKKWTEFRDEVVAISRAIAAAQSQPTPMDIGAVGKGKSDKGGKGSKGAGKRNNQTQQACSRCGNTDHTSANCPHSDKRAENVGMLVIWQVCVDPLELLSPRPRAVRRAQEVAKVRMLSKLVGIVVGMSSQCPKKKVHSVEESTTASQAGKPRHNHDWICRKLLRCWQRE